MITLYVAILNNGWIRSALVSNVLPRLFGTQGVQVRLENLEKTWDRPSSSNRNKIVKRFLETDCDYLMMLDHDVIPLGNPAAFCGLEKDIIGFPAKVRSVSGMNNWILTWVAYKKVKDNDNEYLPIHFENLSDQSQLVPVDAVGTGCILIKRSVVESIKAPFHTDFDEDGILTVGTDFAFCRKATKAGFSVYAAPQCVCEHYKEVGMLGFSAITDTDQIDPAANKYGIPWGGFAINPGDWNFIRDIITRHKPRRILEFGSGLSSLLMSEYANVTSYETDHAYADQIRAQANSNALTIHEWNGTDFLLRNDDHFDLVFIDGPKVNGGSGPGRQEAFRAASLLSDRIIAHDANREQETAWQNTYLAPQFALKKRSGYHQTACHYWERSSHELF